MLKAKPKPFLQKLMVYGYLCLLLLYASKYLFSLITVESIAKLGHDGYVNYWFYWRCGAIFIYSLLVIIGYSLKKIWALYVYWIGYVATVGALSLLVLTDGKGSSGDLYVFLMGIFIMPLVIGSLIHLRFYPESKYFTLN